MIPLDRDALSRIAVRPYATLRPELRTGDVIFCAGQHVFSRLVAWATKSPITHVGIVIRVDELDRVLLLEAVEDFGVRLAPFSDLLRYRGMVFVARSTSVGDLTTAAGWGLDHLAQPYSYLTIARLAARLALGRGRGSDPDATGWICSEYAAAWLALAGEADLVPNGRLVTPADLWSHDSLSFVARLR